MKRPHRAHFDRIAGRHCCLPACRAQPVEVAHVAGAVSEKTGSPLPRRFGPAYFVAVPLCEAHHRTGRDSVHALGERGFERHHGLPEGWLLGLATTLLARTLEEA